VRWVDDGGGLICLVVGDNEHMRVSLTAAHTHASRDGKLSDRLNATGQG
jgi:hypothetical protein